MPERLETAALVIQRFAFGETSQVVHLLTEARGRVVVLAKGAWRDKNSFEGPLDLLVRGRVVLSLVEGRELGLLVRRKIETNYPALRRDARRFLAASRLLARVVRFELVGHGGGGESFRLLDRALQAAETIEPGRLELLRLSFDLRLARLHGIEPVLRQCARCGSPRRLARFVASEGGAVCADCRRGAEEGSPLDPATVALLVELGERPLQRIATPTYAVAARSRRLLDAHLEWHAESAGARAASPAPARAPSRRSIRA
jgi:DNA repair protein RecO (recombination protein O)